MSENSNNNKTELPSAREIVDSEDLNWLYEQNVNLTETISATHKEMREAQTETEKSDAQGELSILYALQEVTKHKIEDLKDTGARANYNFRMAAKLALKPDTYKKLTDLAYKTRQEVKKMKDALKEKPLE